MTSKIIITSKLFYATGFLTTSATLLDWKRGNSNLKSTSCSEEKNSMAHAHIQAFEKSISSDIQPIIISDVVSGIIEVLFINRKQPHTDEQWHALSNVRSLIHIQNSFIIVDEDSGDGNSQKKSRCYSSFMGVSCVNRLIDKILINKQRIAWSQGDHNCERSSLLFEVDDILLDAFRFVSGGNMHYKDHRPWCMTRRALTDMRKNVRKLQSDLNKKQCEIDTTGKNIIAMHNVISNIDSLLSQILPLIDDDTLCYQYRQTRECRELELQHLEDFRLELIGHEDSIKKQLDQLMSVLLRQCELDTARRAGCNLNMDIGKRKLEQD